ncbi:hypothetical protein [Egicoccus sp. AB-alg6-2]|uniref:hypothetical protein n=1 Tax=Egicoccus sp. AB-alg6-2 TaxID=3242692 RepID=UPI00359E0D57
MDPRLLITAIPWVRRAWRMLPPPLRLPVLAVAAAVGGYYAITGREELMNAINEARGESTTIDQRGTTT